jgi:hypothetical protein
MTETALMAADALKDRNEFRKFLPSREGNQIFAEEFKSGPSHPNMLAVSKTSNGLYFISKGYIDGYPISGTNRTISLKEGSLVRVIYKIYEQFLNLSNTSGYVTGRYNILSAELEIAQPGTPLPSDQITLNVSTYYQTLFVWSDRYLTSENQLWYINLGNLPNLQNN